MYIDKGIVLNIVNKLTNQETTRCREYCKLNPADSARREKESMLIRNAYHEVWREIYNFKDWYGVIEGKENQWTILAIGEGGHNMTTITIYDIEAETIEAIAEENQTTEADVVDAIMFAIRSNDIDIKDYL